MRGSKMKRPNISQILVAALVTFSFAQANANAVRAAKGAQKIFTKPNVVKSAAVKGSGVNTAALLTKVMSDAEAAQVLSADPVGVEINNFLDSAEIQNMYSQDEITTVRRAAARRLFKNNALKECLVGIKSPVSRANYVAMLEAGMEPLRKAATTFTTALRQFPSVAKNVGRNMMNALGERLNLSGLVLKDRTANVVDSCAVNGAASPYALGL